MDPSEPQRKGQAALASLIKSATTTISKNASASEPLSHQSEPGQSSAASSKAMENLWLMMTSLYGHKWVSVQGLSDVKLDAAGKPTADSGIWGKVLAGMTGKNLAKGIAACVERGKLRLARGEEDWPPTAPEFRAMCEWSAADLGVPDVQSAFRECISAADAPTVFKFSHELVRIAGKEIGWWNIRHNVPNEKALFKQFETAFGRLVKRLQKGESLEDPQKLLEHEGAEISVGQAERASLRFANDLVRSQGLEDKTPQELRQELLAKVGVRRPKQESDQ